MVRPRRRRGQVSARLGDLRPTAWSLWSLPRHVVAYVLMVDATAVLVTTALLVTHPPRLFDAAIAGGVIALGVVNAELSRHVERMRRRFADTPHVNMTSVWTMAAALLLSPGLAAVVVAVLYLHLWLRSWYRVRGVHAYRLMFSCATIILACHTVTAVQHAIGAEALVTAAFPTALWGVPLVVLAFSAVNSVFIAGAIGLSERTLDPVRLLGTWRENALEYATLCLGVLTAVLVTLKPGLVLLLVPALHVLHRSVLIRQLEQAATADSKTGLLNAAAWHAVASREYERTRREGGTLGILMIDVDNFKQVNDRYGHLVGDRVLQGVATALRDEVRRYDVVGRFGGEEFVIALPDVGAEEIVHVGQRICERIRNVVITTDQEPGLTVGGLSVSVGAATYPAAGDQLDQVLLAADNALFAAKDAGRDRVVSCPVGGPTNS